MHAETGRSEIARSISVDLGGSWLHTASLSTHVDILSSARNHHYRDVVGGGLIDLHNSPRFASILPFAIDWHGLCVVMRFVERGLQRAAAT